MSTQGAFDRRRLIAGTLGAGLATTTLFQIGSAQNQGATPEASPSANTGTGTDERADDRSTERATTAIEWASGTITTVQTDRAAVATQLDATTIDTLLTQAVTLRDRAQQATDGGDTSEAVRLSLAASATAEAGGDLIVAQLTYPGLPSQQARSSRVLAGVYDALKMVSDETAASTNTDVTFSVTTAQAIYATTYDLYTGGAFARATASARASRRLTHAVLLLTASIGAGGPVTLRHESLGHELDGPDGRGHRRGHPGRPLMPGDGPFHEADAVSDEPVSVPEPEF
ncbi:MAG: hypothetical protein H0W06_07835 [Chloroflexia bacterium]|nr:hypothetical protein [Chloroflexia bacterium]